MKTSDESFDEKMGDCCWMIYKLSRNLLAWAVLIESQSDEHEKLAELEGLGMSLRNYSEILQHIRSSIDDMCVEVEAQNHSDKKGRSKRRV